MPARPPPKKLRPPGVPGLTGLRGLTGLPVLPSSISLAAASLLSLVLPLEDVEVRWARDCVPGGDMLLVFLAKLFPVLLLLTES